MNSVLVEDDLSGKKLCLGCNEAIAIESKFCRHCGAVQTAGELVSTDKKWGIIKQLTLFYGFNIIICCLASFIDDFKTLSWSVFFDVLLAVIAITFFCSDWQTNKYLLRWPDFSFSKLCLYLALAIIGSVCVSYCINWLNHTLFSQEMYYYGIFSSNRYGKILMLFFVAVMPAMFEELAFRGYMLQKLTALADSRQAVFITSFLFAIIHMSFLSLFWLIPFALLIGFLRMKEQTIWYGVFFHFAFNLTGCMLELSELYGDEAFRGILPW